MSEPEYLIDISSHNPVRSWSEVRRNGIVGASVKATQATDYVNPLLGSQVGGARGSGVLAGCYHFGDPRYDARAQAEFFEYRAGNVGAFGSGSLAPMYDAENWDGNSAWQSRGQLSDHIGTWLDVLAENTDVRQAFVYGSLSWWGSMLVPADWADHTVKVLNWIAVYNGRPGDLQGWSHPNDAVHQYTSAGVVDGIDGRVDKNVTLRGRSIAHGPDQEDDDMGTWTTPITLSADERRQYEPGWTGGDTTFTPDVWTKYSSFYAGLNLAAIKETQAMLVASAAREVAMLAALGTIARDPLVTEEKLREMINDAVKDHVKITGTIEIASVLPTPDDSDQG